MTVTGPPKRLGFLGELLADATVEEIIVIGGHRTFVVRNGVKELLPVIADTATLRRFADQLLAGTGRRLDLSSPIVSAQLSTPSSMDPMWPTFMSLLGILGPDISTLDWRTGALDAL